MTDAYASVFKEAPCGTSAWHSHDYESARGLKLYRIKYKGKEKEKMKYNLTSTCHYTRPMCHELTTSTRLRALACVQRIIEQTEQNEALQDYSIIVAPSLPSVFSDLRVQHYRG